jgi:thiamine pyrophosphokinase
MSEIVLVGPMGPALPDAFQRLFVIAVDGGADHSARVDLWVGDADSIGVPLPESKRIHLEKEKSQSDLAHALAEVPADVTGVHLWGFLGGRRDHEWLSIGEVARWLQSRSSTCARVYDHRGIITVQLLTRGGFVHQGVFSVATLEPNRVVITGSCKYVLSQPTELLPLSSHGLSNHATGRVEVAADRPVLVFLHSG